MTEVHSLGEVTTTNINDVHPAPDNPRKINAAAVDIVAKSLKRFGWQQPIVVDADRTIIAGHTRYRAAKQLGLDVVPIVVADNLTPDEVKAYRIADNRTGDFSQWDFPELVMQLEELSAGFSDELALAEWEAISADFEAEFSSLEAPVVPQAQQQYPAPTPAPTPEAEEGLGAPRDEVTPPQAPQDSTPPPLQVSESVRQQFETRFELHVVCADAQTAARVQLLLAEEDGVVDVRYRR